MSKVALVRRLIPFLGLSTNPGSIALHERFGMEKVAHFKEVGRKFDQWIDVGHWQRILS